MYPGSGTTALASNTALPSSISHVPLVVKLNDFENKCQESTSAGDGLNLFPEPRDRSRKRSGRVRGKDAVHWDSPRWWLDRWPKTTWPRSSIMAELKFAVGFPSAPGDRSKRVPGVIRRSLSASRESVQIAWQPGPNPSAVPTGYVASSASKTRCHARCWQSSHTVRPKTERRKAYRDSRRSLCTTRESLPGVPRPKCQFH